MYVIFPADEVVCLSYGRVIYVPPLRSTANVNKIETNESSNINQKLNTSCPSVPSTSTDSSRSLAAKIINGDNLDDSVTDKKFYIKNRDSGSRRSAKSANSSESHSSARPVTISSQESGSRISGRSTNSSVEIGSQNVSFLLRKEDNQEKRSKSPRDSFPTTERKKEKSKIEEGKIKNTNEEKRLSFSDFLPLNRERNVHKLNLLGSLKTKNRELNSIKTRRSSLDLDEIFKTIDNQIVETRTVFVEAPQLTTGEGIKFVSI